MAAPDTTADPAPVILTPEQQKEQLDQAIERLDKHAESQLNMAQLFIARGKTDIARRRLEELLELYGKSDAAREARKLLKRL
jgi:FimV-like protein